MLKRHWKPLGGVLLAALMIGLTMITVRAAGGNLQWTTDTFPDFLQGSLTGVDVWSNPGAAQLDYAWWTNAQVNDVTDQSQLSPRLSFALTNTAIITDTVFLAVWADERTQDHYPDIYFARSVDGGQSWSSDHLVSGAHQEDQGNHTPDITVRLADGSFWVVWQQDDIDDPNDDGDIYYATSSDGGNNWSASGEVYTGTGTQLHPRIAPHAQSGYMYTLWEDERDDDGDIYISRYNPDLESSWGTPVKISDAISGTQQREPNLAVDVDGNVYAVWEDFRDDQEGYDPHVYFSRWISGTLSWSEWYTNTRLSDAAMDWAEDPVIVPAPGGRLLAAWAERVPTGPATYDFQIVLGLSGDNGETWSRSVVDRLENAPASNAFYSNPAIGIDLSGQIYVAWIYSPDSQASQANVYFAQSPDGGHSWTEPRTVNRPSNVVNIAPPDLITGFDGEVVVAWEDYRSTQEVYAAGYPADDYLSTGFFARTLDAGGPAAWNTITWTATISPDTGLVLASRVMTSAGAGWTEWVTHTSSVEALSHPSGRFFEYRAVFTSTGSNTSALEEVIVSYSQYDLFLPVVLKGK